MSDQITTPVTNATTGPQLGVILAELNDWWFGAASRDGEPTIAGSVHRLQALLSSTALAGDMCGNSRVEYLPRVNLLNEPNTLVLTSLFGAGEDGAWAGALAGVFADTAGTTPATFGGSVARVNDQSGNARNWSQASASLRPLLGRAPVDAEPGGAIDQGSGPAFLRFDLSDDVLPTVVPDGGTFDVLIPGRQGAWIERGVVVPPGGALNLGPTTLNVGSTPVATIGLLGAIGDLVDAPVALDRAMTQAEIDLLLAYYRNRGAKGLLVPGPELNPGFANWTGLGALGTHFSYQAGPPEKIVWNNWSSDSRTTFSGNTIAGRWYLMTWTATTSVGSIRLVNDNAGNIMLSNIQNASSLVARALGTNGFGFRAQGTTGTGELTAFSLRELRPQEDW